MTPYAAILAGGSGTRFWPASTRDVPKQLLPLTGGAPLLVETVSRLEGLVPRERVLVVTSARHAAAARALLPGVPPENVIGEPVARNTAAACAIAAHWVRAREPDAVLFSLPADHVVAPPEELRATLAAAATRAIAAGSLVTLGLEPTNAATGYGWIETGASVSEVGGCTLHAVKSFVEKPDRAKAELYLARRDHLWNLGMFTWTADAFLGELEAHLPEVATPIAAAAAALAGGDDDGFARAFGDAAAISVDHGVLERSERVEVIPCTFAWDDLGSFAALARHVASDDAGNAAVGPVVALDSRDCITWAEDGRLTALLGVKDLIVVHANGVTLVAPRVRAEDVRRLVDELGPAGYDRFA